MKAIEFNKIFKFNDEFFKDKMDCEQFEDNIYNQIAKTMARNIDIDLAKTPLVDILTGYTRYREAEKEIERLSNIINNAIKYVEKNTHNIYADGYRDRETGELLSIEKTPIVNRVFSKNPKELLEILHGRQQ